VEEKDLYSGVVVTNTMVSGDNGHVGKIEALL